MRIVARELGLDVGVVALSAARLFAKALSESAGEKAGEKGWSVLGRLIDFLRKRFKNSETAKAKLQRVEDDPSDEQAVSDLAQTIETIAISDPDALTALAALVEEARNAPETRSMVVTTFGDAQVGKIVQIGRIEGPATF